MGPVALPRRLPPGGAVGVCAPSGPVNAQRLAAGLDGLRAAGFSTVLSPGLMDRAGYLAGDDAARAADLQALLDDPGVDAVVCARGGYGAMRILPRVDFTALQRRPKPVVGYSDVTALHLALARAGVVSFHGAMVESGAGAASAANRASMLRAITLPEPLGELPVPEGEAPPCGWVEGYAHGPLVGGNLSLLAATLGTPWEVQPQGALLLIEDVNEPPYRLDRYLTQLWLAGKLAAAAGFVVGELVGCDPAEGEGPGAEAVVRERLLPLRRPCAAGFCLGHGTHKLTVPLGVPAELEVGGDRAALRFTASHLL